jgi:hypothetical protein
MLNEGLSASRDASTQVEDVNNIGREKIGHEVVSYESNTRAYALGRNLDRPSAIQYSETAFAQVFRAIALNCRIQERGYGLVIFEA